MARTFLESCKEFFKRLNQKRVAEIQMTLIGTIVEEDRENNQVNIEYQLISSARIHKNLTPEEVYGKMLSLMQDQHAKGDYSD